MKKLIEVKKTDCEGRCAKHHCYINVPKEYVIEKKVKGLYRTVTHIRLTDEGINFVCKSLSKYGGGFYDYKDVCNKDIPEIIKILEKQIDKLQFELNQVRETRLS